MGSRMLGSWRVAVRGVGSRVGLGSGELGLGELESRGLG